MPERVVFDHRPPLQGRVQSLRGMPLVSFFTRAHSDTLLCSRRITKLSHPPTLGGGPGGQQGKLPSGPLIYLSTLPGQPSINPIYPHSQLLTVVPLSLCYVRYQGLSAGRRPSARGDRRMGGRATVYRGG